MTKFHVYACVLKNLLSANREAVPVSVQPPCAETG